VWLAEDALIRDQPQSAETPDPSATALRYPTGIRARWQLDGNLDIEGEDGDPCPTDRVAGSDGARPVPVPQWDDTSAVTNMTPTQQAVAAIWRGLLGDQAASDIDDNFFAVGGSSLQAVQLITRIRETFQVEIELAAAFTDGSIRQLAEMIDEEFAKAIAGLSEEELRTLLGDLDEVSAEEAKRLLARGNAASQTDEVG
jgi:acyl carrier protein